MGFSSKLLSTLNWRLHYNTQIATLLLLACPALQNILKRLWECVGMRESTDIPSDFSVIPFYSSKALLCSLWHYFPLWLPEVNKETQLKHRQAKTYDKIRRFRVVMMPLSRYMVTYTKCKFQQVSRSSVCNICYIIYFTYVANHQIMLGHIAHTIDCIQ